MNQFFNPSETISLVKIKLKRLKYQLTKLFKRIFESCSLTPIINSLEASQNQEIIENCIENFVKLCSDLLEHEKFACYYEEKFNLSDQIGLMVQLTNNKM